MKTTTSFFSVGLLLVSLAALPGCGLVDWVKEKANCSSCGSHAGSSEAVITIGGKTSLTGEQVDKKLAMLFQQQAQMAEMIGRMDEAQQLGIYEQFANRFADEQLMLDYVKEQKLDQTPEIKEVVAQAHRQLDLEVAAKVLQDSIGQEIKSKITDDEAKKFYADNRETEKIFQQAPFLLNEAAVKAKDKKAKAEFAPFEAVADFVKQVIAITRLQAAIAEKLDTLKKDRQVTVNMDYFKKFVVSKEQPAAPEATAEAAAKPAVKTV